MSYTGAGYAQPLWYLPLFAARMDDGSGAEIVVQNAGPETLASGALTIECHPGPRQPRRRGFVWTNPQPIPGLAPWPALDNGCARDSGGLWGHLSRSRSPARVCQCCAV
ncbi:MAG: hypothetical protein U0X20_02075 [Caldilineaceae bacterium]